MWTEEVEHGDNTKYTKSLGMHWGITFSVGTRDRENINYIEAKSLDNTGNDFKEFKYIFEGEKLKGIDCQIARNSLEEISVNLTPLKPEHKIHFEELGEQVPGLEASLLKGFKNIMKYTKRHK